MQLIQCRKNFQVARNFTLSIYYMRNLKNRIRNSVSFLKKFNKRGTLVGLTFFQHIFLSQAWEK